MGKHEANGKELSQGINDATVNDKLADSKDNKVAATNQAADIPVEPVAVEKIKSNVSESENKNELCEETASLPKEVTAPSSLKDSISEIECSQDSCATSDKKAKEEVESLFEQVEQLELRKKEDEGIKKPEQLKLESIEIDDCIEKLDEIPNLEVSDCELANVNVEEADETNENLGEPDDGDMDGMSSGTADEWDMIDEQKDQTENDEVLARAAQLVGSALFEEDNSKSESFFSLLSVESDIPLAVATRWHNELVQLREIGFVDDKESVAVLEELQAANIGVDSDEPIKIEKVIERLFERK